MRKPTKDELGRLVYSVAEIYDVKLSSDALAWYWLTLQDKDLDALKAAIKEHIEDPEAGKWMPKPADILRLYEAPTCQQCHGMGLVVRDGDKLLPWSLERECRQGLKHEICPECRGEDRIPHVPGRPIVA